MMRRTLLLALLGAAGAAADDVSALVQAQVQRHGRQGAARLEGLERALGGAADGLSRQLLQALSGLPAPARQVPDALGGLYIKRSGQQAEEGSGVDFSVDRGCAVHDASGSNDCTLRWGDNVSVSYRVRLAKGLRRGDRVSVSMASRFQATNASDPMAAVLKGGAVASGFSCDVCEGSCTTSLAAAEGQFLLDTTSPSFVNETFCAGLEAEPMRSLDLGQASLSLPAPPPAWQLSGEIVTSVEVRARDGTVRLSETMENKVLPGAAGGSLAARAPALPSSLAAALEQSLRQVAPAMLRESHRAVAAEHKARAGARAGRRAGKKIGALVLKLHVSDLERASGQNVTLSAEPGCTALDGAGSTECRLEFAKAAEVRVGLHLAYATEAGSYAVVKTTPKVGGMLGMMAGAFLKPVTLRLPLCGKGTVKAAEGAPASEVDAGPCGFHAANLVAPAFQMLLPDLAAVSLKVPGAPPILPPTIGDLPPTSVQVDAQMFHADGAPIGHFALELGLGYPAA